MKKGSKPGGAASSAENAAASAPIFAAIPFPPGLSLTVAETPEIVPSFTEREQQVGGWVAEGKRDAEIADILTVGLETVKTHVKKLLEKAGVETRGAFIAWVWRNRLAAGLSQAVPGKPIKYT